MKTLDSKTLEMLISIMDKVDQKLITPDEQKIIDETKDTMSERLEIESMDFDDCEGGACKL